MTANDVDALLTDKASAPVARTVPRPVDRGEAGALVVESAKPNRGRNSRREMSRDDDSDALPDLAPTIHVTDAPAVRPGLAGMPNPEEAPEVVQCRANHARLADDLRAVAAERAALESELGIPAGARASVVQKVAVELLILGVSREKIERLKTLAESERLLTIACDLAAKRVADLLTDARRKLSGQAVAAVYRPVAERAAVAFLAYLAAMRDVAAAVETLQSTGMAGALNGMGTYNLCIETRGQNNTVAELVREGYLTRAEVQAALPELVAY